MILKRVSRLACLLVPVVGSLGLAASCAPEYGETPFACGEDGTCPEGYTCQSTVCVEDGATLVQARPMRVSWINSGEMYWFGSPTDGATLVVNDGFTPSARGLYEIRVSANGQVAEPRLLRKLGDEFPTASSVVALSDQRYAVTLLNFPNASTASYELTVLGIEREAAEGITPVAETLYSLSQPFVGGYEPAYVGSVGGGDRLDIGFTRPSDGGAVVLIRLERQGAVWEATRTVELPLPEGVLPLSGDVYLWDLGEGRLAVRVGFDSFAMAVVEEDGTATEFVASEGLPLHAWPSGNLVMHYDDEDDDGYVVSFALEDQSAEVQTTEGGFRLQDALEPHVALPYADGAIVAPLSSDPGFSSFGVGYRTESLGLVEIATFERQAVEEMYSTRVFVHEGTVYAAWTQFHESLMDLWVGSAPAKGL